MLQLGGKKSGGTAGHDGLTRNRADAGHIPPQKQQNRDEGRDRKTAQGLGEVREK